MLIDIRQGASKNQLLLALSGLAGRCQRRQQEMAPGLGERWGLHQRLGIVVGIIEQVAQRWRDGKEGLVAQGGRRLVWDIQHDKAVRPRGIEGVPRPGGDHHALAPVNAPATAIDFKLHDAGLRQHDLLEIVLMGHAFAGVGAQVQDRACHESVLVGYRGLTYRKFTAVCRRARLPACLSVGAGHARDECAAVHLIHRSDPIAGKPACVLRWR
ncbi:hypothetical protein D3C85_1003250 [compost metagenome]